ncbi:MAG: hypothetical protein ACLR43_10420 [Faecalibacillus faecis]
MGQAEGYVIPEGKAAESLNNEAPSVNAENFKGVINEDTYKYSARAVIDGYEDNDMPLGCSYQMMDMVVDMVKMVIIKTY